MKKSVLLGLNEINFEFIRDYIGQGHLRTFKYIFDTYGYIRTSSEKEYDLLEPWIQWVSIHTGKTYEEHQVFRLGDIVERPDLVQVWEIAEQKGLRVGAVSPFNARNNLKSPAFFVPDPWTKTNAAGSKTLIDLSNAVSSAVNNNASQKLGIASLTAILKGLTQYVPANRYPHYVALASRFKQKMAKPAILDNLLADTFIHSWKTTQPDFSSLFLNSGAHIQHHYMFNSAVYRGDQKNPRWYISANEDPLLDILKEYDSILSRLLELNCRLFIATGLHQNPYQKSAYYWRLKNHAAFLKEVGITSFKEVVPRMSRDFLIECNGPEECLSIQQKLESLQLKNDQEKIFTVDNRGKSLFIELTYSKDLKKGSYLEIPDDAHIDLAEYVAFVAIKNGEHNGIGYYMDTDKKFTADKTIPVKQIFNEMVASFD
jgi:hypothetical protein